MQQLPGANRFRARGLADIAVVVVEDDHGDAVYLGACLQEIGVVESHIRWATDLHAGVAAVGGQVDCVLVDLGLPDAQGLEAVEVMLDAAPTAAVIVLTGLDDQRVEAALAAGAQDYLTKNNLAPETLSRSIRYAVERKAAELTARQLAEARILHSENQRLSRGLLPNPVVRDANFDVAIAYRPATDRMILGGDFVDAIETGDGSLRLIIGDVMGHGPDQAAIGVQLRAAWRSLVLAGLAQPEVLDALSRMVMLEAPDGSFVTACDVVINPSRERAHVISAGHPPPVAASPSVHYLDVRANPPLGLATFEAAVPAAFTLPPAWRLMLYTDGLLDSFRDQDAAGDVGLDGLLRVAADGLSEPSARGWIDLVLDKAKEPITDDLAVLSVTCGTGLAR